MADDHGAVAAQYHGLCRSEETCYLRGSLRRFHLAGAFENRHPLIENRAVVVHRPNGLADDAQQDHRGRMEVDGRTDVASDLINSLMDSRLRHDLIEVDGKQLARFHKGGTLARHEEHAFAVGKPRAEVSEGIAQAFTVDDPERGDEVSFQTGNVVILLFHDRSFDEVFATFVSPDFHIKGDRPLLSFSGLELHRVPFVKIFQLGARRETSSMKKDIFAAVVGSNKTESLLPNDFLYRPRHILTLLSDLRPAMLDISAPATSLERSTSYNQNQLEFNCL